jgi:hypothetical protein
MPRRKRAKTKNVKPSECVICLERVSLDGEHVVKLSELLFDETVIKTCECACDVHANCAIKWVNITGKCPICRTRCVIDLNADSQLYADSQLVIFNPQVPRRTQTYWCIQFCMQLVLYGLLFIHTNIVLYTFFIYGSKIFNVVYQID